MQRRRIIHVVFACIITTIMAMLFFSKKTERWMVYYGQELPAESFAAYDLVVFDRDGHPPLHTLINPNRILLGYVSMGEAEPHRKDYNEVKALGVVIESIPGWQGNPMLDVRSPRWHEYMLGTIIPDVLRKGFNGIMLDTTDSLIWLENKDPVHYIGMQFAAVKLIKEIHTRYPKLAIMLNRGFELLPYLGGDIDMVLAESTYASWNAANKAYETSLPAAHQGYVGKLKAAQKHFRNLKIYTLDYWNPEDSNTIRSIYEQQRSYGFIPYVSTADLQKLIAEPARN